MAKYPKKVVDLANGGIFKRVVGRHFHYTPAQRRAAADAVDNISPEDWARHNKIKDKRRAYVGGTPGKDSATGRSVLDRMHSEGKVKGYNPDNPGDLSRVRVKGSDNKWYPLDDCDMGHVPVDAVAYWNNVGRFYGPRSPEVRDWMTDPDNYEIQPRVLNQGDGSIMSSSGMRYQPPVTLPDGVDINDVAPEILRELQTNWKGNPV